MMRLRLRILRNELPAVNTLWPISDTQLNHTIVQLLEQVNAIFPLESDTWGLEHYTVTVGSYECLHYHELGAVCKDEDEVVIRPLQYAEIRARTLLGRDQIAPDGRHLHDGLPWGRPMLRRAIRPSLRIPKMRRQEVMEDDEDTENLNGQMLITGGEAEGGTPEVAQIPDELQQGPNEIEDEDKDDEDEEEFDPDAEEVSTTSDNTSSEDESDSDDDSSDEVSSDDTSSASDDGSISVNEGAPLSNKSEVSFNEIALDGPAKSSPKNEVDKRTSDAKLDATAMKDQASSKPSKPGLPFQGKPETKERNKRRREQKKVKYLVETGVLPQSAGLKDLYEWQEQGERAAPNGYVTKAGATSCAVQVDGSPTAKSTTPAENGSANVNQSPKSKKQEIMEHRQGLSDAIASGGVVMTVPEAKTKAKRKAEALSEEPPEELSSADPANGLEAPARKGTAGSTNDQCSRLIFGSLGLRVPKTQPDKEATRQKLASRAGRNVSAPASVTGDSKIGTKSTNAPTESVGQEEDQDPDAWREKIELSAVECVDEGVTYPPPPFPFRKHWHNKKDRNNSVYMAPNKKRKKDRRDDVSRAQIIENYDKYNTDGTGDALDYDDDDDVEAEEGEDEEYLNDNALLGDTYEDDCDAQEQDPVSQQLLGEIVPHGKIEIAATDNFPAFPQDLSILPPLAEHDAKVNDYIVYEELACSSVTAWQPMMVTCMAQLQSKINDGEWHVLLAKPETKPEKRFGKDGKRIYQKFEMEGLSEDEDEEDERAKSLVWAQMAGIKLLLRASEHEGVQV